MTIKEQEFKRNVCEWLITQHDTTARSPMLEVFSTCGSLSGMLGFVNAKCYEALSDNTFSYFPWSVHDNGNLLKSKKLGITYISPIDLFKQVTVPPETLIVESTQQGLSTKLQPLFITFTSIHTALNLCLKTEYISYLFIDVKNITDMLNTLLEVSKRFPFVINSISNSTLAAYCDTHKYKTDSKFFILRITPKEFIYPASALKMYKFNAVCIDVLAQATRLGITRTPILRLVATDNLEGAVLEEGALRGYIKGNLYMDGENADIIKQTSVFNILRMPIKVIHKKVLEETLLNYTLHLRG